MPYTISGYTERPIRLLIFDDETYVIEHNVIVPEGPYVICVATAAPKFIAGRGLDDHTAIAYANVIPKEVKDTMAEFLKQKELHELKQKKKFYDAVTLGLQI